MKPKIYEMAHSPFCIPITGALTCLGVEFERVEVPNADRSEIIRLTGGRYYQVPVLVRGGDTVFESTADSQDVAAYVDRTFAGGRLFPEATRGLQDILIQHIENDIESVTFKLVDPHYLDTIEDQVQRVMTRRHKERRFGPGCVERWRADAAELRAQADRLLGRFESLLRHSPFILGQSPVYVDFALYGVLGNLLFAGWNSLGESQGALRDWMARLAAHRFKP